jgi:hypothetical protein
MLINLTEEIRKETLLTHIILNGITKAALESCLKGARTKTGIVADIKITINKKEVNLEKFCNIWQKQVKMSIAKQAEKLAKDKLYSTFNDVEDLMTDLKQRLLIPIRARLEEWEKEDYL